MHNSSDLITLIDADLAITYQTPSITRLLGYAEDELIGTQLADLTHPEDRLSLFAARAEATAEDQASATSHLRLRHRDGSYRHVQSIHTNLLADPDVRAVVVTTRDVTAQKELEAQLQHNAFHDALTGLANRALFADRLEHALARTDRHATPVAVLFVDLDDFKAVNDGAGHSAGDQLLVAVAERLRRVLRPSDTIARLGGDEFAVLIEDAGRRRRRPQAAADRLLAALAEPFPGPTGPPTTQVRITASVGIATGRRRAARRRRAAAARRRRHVRGQGGRQGPVGGLRARHGLRDHRPAPAQGRARPGRRARRVHRPLPADRGAGDRPAGRRRGAGPLAAPRARAGARRWTSSRWPSRPA